MQGETPAFGKGAVLAHRLARPLAAESDEKQRATSHAVCSARVLLRGRRSTRPARCAAVTSLSSAFASKQQRGCGTAWVVPPLSRNRGGRHERIHAGPARRGRRERSEARRWDTKTEAGEPKEAPESEQQSKKTSSRVVPRQPGDPVTAVVRGTLPACVLLLPPCGTASGPSMLDSSSFAGVTSRWCPREGGPHEE